MLEPLECDESDGNKISRHSSELSIKSALVRQHSYGFKISIRTTQGALSLNLTSLPPNRLFIDFFVVLCSKSNETNFLCSC